MKRGWVMATVLAFLAASIQAEAAEAASFSRPGCLATSDAAHAARRLLDPAATVVSLDDAGRSALVSVPLVVTGARHRLLRTSDGWWCDALAGYNAIAAGRDARAVAIGFASVAAARYFDGIDVRSARVTAPGQVRLQTHARTNGVVADWTVHVDGSGIRKATWTATEFAVAPFDAQLYGPTALPGATMSYKRLPDGRLTAVRDPFLEAGDDPPVKTSIVDMSDGFRIIVSRGNAPYVYPDVRTGQYDVDSLALAVRATRSNYEDFLSWGMHGSWPAPGHVFVDGGLAPAYCLACVQSSVRVFNVHIFSRIATYVAALGYTYPDPELAFSKFMGHEIFHNFQMSYGGLGRGPAWVAFSEGTARLQETLHDYSHVNHQRGSMLYGGGANGCNGYLDDMGAAISDHRYDACLFWFSFYADQGLPGLLRLLEAIGTAPTLEQAVEEATGEPLADTASRFASRILTRQPLAWAPPTGDGSVLDWSAHLWGWSAEALGSGLTSVLGRGGVMAAALQATTTLDLTASDPGVVFRVVRRTSAGFDTEPAQDGMTVLGPGPGESVWITAASGVDADVTMAPVDADPPPDPSRVSWSQLEARPYRYTNPLGRTDALASGDLATLGFDLYSFASDPVAMPILTTSADAIAELRGTASVESGLHAVTVRIRLDDVSLTTTRSVPSAHISTANGSLAMELSCADTSPGCSAYDSASYSQSSEAQPGVVTLRAVIDVPTAQMLKVTTTLSAESSGRGGSAEATLAGEVIEAGIVKL